MNFHTKLKAYCEAKEMNSLNIYSYVSFETNNKKTHFVKCCIQFTSSIIQVYMYPNLLLES